MILRWVLLAVLLLLDSPGVHAMGNHADVVRDQYGRALGGATISVFNAGTSVFASIFSDNGVTPLANPLTSDVLDGRYNFYAANGVYDIVFSHPQATFDPLHTKRISVVDGSDLSGGGGGGGTAQGLDANFDIQPEINGATTANPFIVGYGSKKWQFGTDPTTGLFQDCIVDSVIGACNYVRRLNAGFYWEIQSNTGSSIGRISNDTGRFTNAIVRDESHWPVATCQNATASANYDLPTTNAPTPTCDTGSNTQKGYLAFNDTTEQSFQDHMILPGGFVSMDIQLRWKGANTTNAARWCAQLVRVPDGATSDPAFPSQASGNCVNDTAKGTTLQENVATIPAVTCSSCVGGDHVYIRVSRMAADAADTFVGNALLLTYGRVLDRALQ